MENTWMQLNFTYLKDQPLSKILLPGTHDSGAMQVNYMKSRFNLCIFSSCINPWTITQRKTILYQLDLGIRAFDLRISYVQPEKKGDCPFYISHNFACIPLDEAIQQFTEYLKAYTCEVLVISVKIDYSNRAGMKGHEQELAQYLEDKFKGLLYKKKDEANFSDPDMTLMKMCRSYKRVVMFSDVSVHGENLWPIDSFKTNWMNKAYKNTWLQELNNRWEKNTLDTDPENCNQLPLTLTPNKKYILQNLCGPSLEGMAVSMRDVLKTCLADPRYENINVYAVDYVTPQFVDAIVDKNVDKYKREYEINNPIHIPVCYL